MPKYLLVNRAKGQATAAPNASATSITLTASGDTAEFTADGSPSATNPISAILTDVADITAPTLIETVLITDITGDVLTLTRDADGQGGQDFSSGSCYITVVDSAHLLKNMVQRSGDAVQDLGALQYDNGASGTFDYNNGEYQKCTLTASSTAITFTNIPTGRAMYAEIYAADTYAPDVSAITPIRDGATIDFGPAIMIGARKFGDGTQRYTAGGSWAS